MRLDLNALMELVSFRPVLLKTLSVIIMDSVRPVSVCVLMVLLAFYVKPVYKVISLREICALSNILR